MLVKSLVFRAHFGPVVSQRLLEISRSLTKRLTVEMSRGKRRILSELKQFLQQTTELVPQIGTLLEKIAFLIFQLASWTALIMLVSGGFS